MWGQSGKMDFLMIEDGRYVSSPRGRWIVAIDGQVAEPLSLEEVLGLM